jgi:hypothetical protein
LSVNRRGYSDPGLGFELGEVYIVDGPKAEAVERAIMQDNTIAKPILDNLNTFFNG